MDAKGAKGAKGAKKSGKAGGRSGKSRAAAAAKALVALVVLAAAAAGAYYYFIYSKPAAAAEVEVQQTGVARRGDISVTISGAGPVSYSVRRDVKSEINGSVLKANFSEGELVKAGDVIFEIDNKETLDAISQIENEIKQQEISNASLSPQDFGSMQIYALGNGLVSNVGVHVGDDVNKGSTVMTITDKNSLSALFPFAAEDAALLSVGQDVTLVNLDGEFEECPAKITDIQRDAGGAAAVYVEITAQISQQLKNGTNVAALVKRADLPAQAGLGAAAGGDAGAGAGAGAGEGAGGGGGSGDAGAAGGASGGGSGVAGEGASGGSGNGASGSNGNSGAAGANGAAEAAEAGDGAGVIAEAGAGGGSGAGESEGGDSGAAAGADGGAGAEAGGGQAAGAGAYDSAASDVDAASGESAATAARRAAKAAAAQAQEPAPQAADMRALDTASLSFKSELAVKSLGTGTVTAVNAKENDYVREGQLLVQMSNSDDSYAYSKALNDLKMQNLANNLEAAREKLDDYIIYAPIDGMFVSQPISRDDYIASNQVVCTIVDPDSMEFVTDVDELDIDRVAVGQSVDVSFDAITDTQAIPVKGEIKKIAIEGTSSGGVTTYGVTIGVEPSGRIKAGMNADGVIYIESKSDVVFVPVEAVTLIGGSLAYVYVVDESAAAGEGGEAAAGGAAAGGEAGAEGGAPPAAPAGAGEGAGVDEGAGAGTGGGAGIGNGAGGPGAATADGAGAAVLGDGALGNSGAADGADAPEQAGGEPLSGSGGAPGFRPSFDGSFTGSFGGRPGGGAGFGASAMSGGGFSGSRPPSGGEGAPPRGGLQASGAGGGEAGGADAESAGGADAATLEARSVAAGIGAGAAQVADRGGAAGAGDAAGTGAAGAGASAGAASSASANVDNSPTSASASVGNGATDAAGAASDASASAGNGSGAGASVNNVGGGVGAGDGATGGEWPPAGGLGGGGRRFQLTDGTPGTGYYEGSVVRIVEIGVSNDTYIEIASGLEEGEIIVLPLTVGGSGDSQQQMMGGMMQFGVGAAPAGGGVMGAAPMGGGTATNRGGGGAAVYVR